VLLAGALLVQPPESSSRLMYGCLPRRRRCSRHSTAPTTAPDGQDLAALVHRLPWDVLGRIRLLVRPETVLRWHGT
jgi:hypothetical protein